MTAPDLTKRCTMCGEDRSVTAFPRYKGTGKPRSRCKNCHAESERRRRQTLPRNTRTCADCGAKIDGRGPQALVCADCARSRRRRSSHLAPLDKRRDTSVVLPLIRQGATPTEACRSTGISWNTVDRRRAADPQFARELADAISVGQRVRLEPCGTNAKFRRGCTCEPCRKASIQYGVACRARVNDESIPQARRRNYQWTGPELELIARNDLSAEEVAGMIGRTILGVKSMRWKLSREPTPQWLAGQRSRLH